MNILDVSLAILIWVAPTSPVHTCPKSEDGWRSILFRWGNGLRCLVGRIWSMLCYWRCLEHSPQNELWQCTACSSELSHSRNRDISSIQEMHFFPIICFIYKNGRFRWLEAWFCSFVYLIKDDTMEAFNKACLFLSKDVNKVVNNFREPRTALSYILKTLW